MANVTRLQDKDERQGTLIIAIGVFWYWNDITARPIREKSRLSRWMVTVDSNKMRQDEPSLEPPSSQNRQVSAIPMQHGAITGEETISSISDDTSMLLYTNVEHQTKLCFVSRQMVIYSHWKEHVLKQRIFSHRRVDQTRPCTYFLCVFIIRFFYLCLPIFGAAYKQIILFWCEGIVYSGCFVRLCVVRMWPDTCNSYIRPFGWHHVTRVEIRCWCPCICKRWRCRSIWDTPPLALALLAIFSHKYGPVARYIHQFQL